MTAYKDVIIIGAGPAGLAASVEVKKNGVEDVLVIEREPYAGGILNQCIHDGFGVTKFKEALTGPEYAGRYIDEAKKLKVEILSGAMVIDLTPDRKVTVISPEGMTVYKAGAIILAMGCRERTRGALSRYLYGRGGTAFCQPEKHNDRQKSDHIGLRGYRADNGQEAYP